MQDRKKNAIKGKTNKPRVSNRLSLDAERPIPIGYGNNVFSFVHQVSYIPFLQPKDNFAQTLIETRFLSDTHNACVVTKKDYCAGEGFHYTNSDKPFSEDQKNWFKSMNRKNQSALKINKKIFEDLFTWGNVPIEIIKTTVTGKNYLYVIPHSFLEWRLGKPNDDDVVEYAIQSKLFLKNTGAYLTADALKKSKKLPIYNPMNTDKQNWEKDEFGGYRTLLWLKNDVSGFPYYGMPSAIASLIYQILEYKSARYNLDNFDNNMIAAAILALKGSLGQEEANKIAKEIIKQHTGDGKRGRTVVIASEEGIDGSDFHKIDTKADGSFKESDDAWSQKIILANQWDAILAGIISPSTLGKGSGFLTKIYEQKLKSVIIPAQQTLMDEVWSTIFEIANDWLKLDIDVENIAIKNSIDISGLTDVDITPAVTRNEVRKAKGLAEDNTPAGKEYMKSTGPVAKQKEEGGDDV
jgi:hypothetical protein